MNDSDYGCVVRIFVGPLYVRLYWQPTLKRAIEQWRPKISVVLKNSFGWGGGGGGGKYFTGV